MFVYSSFKMEGDSAVRGYRDAQINRFESQLSEINLLHKESFVINLSSKVMNFMQTQEWGLMILDGKAFFDRSKCFFRNEASEAF